MNVKIFQRGLTGHNLMFRFVVFDTLNLFSNERGKRDFHVTGLNCHSQVSCRFVLLCPRKLIKEVLSQIVHEILRPSN